MPKLSYISILIACLPGASFGITNYEYAKSKVNQAIKDNSIEFSSSISGNFSDRCQNGGIHRNDYTVDRRCYLTDEQKQEPPYNAVVALYNEYGNYCTGTIVKNPNDGKLYVYTAKHCVESNGTEPLSVRMQDGTEMTVKFMYMGMGKQHSDSAIYKIPDEYTANIPFVTTGGMYSGYFEIVGYGALPIMSDKQIDATRKAFKQALTDKKIDFVEKIHNKAFKQMFPDDAHQLKSSLHCRLVNRDSLGEEKASVDKTNCQAWHGNSGGPVFDEDGQMVAILTHGVGMASDDWYAETFLGGQEEVSDIQDEITNSNSKLRDKAGRCFTAVRNKDDQYIISNSDLCVDIPFGGWNITLGNGATYTGFARCMPSNNIFEIDDFNHSTTGQYCWCKTNGANTNWEYSYNSYTDSDRCENWCELDCAKDFAVKEKILTRAPEPKTPNALLFDKTGICFAKIDYHGDYAFTKVDSSQCAGMPYGSWSFIHTNGTKYSGLAKCAPTDSTLNNGEFNTMLDRSTTGKYCWCKLDGANSTWGKGATFDNSDKCEDLCEKRCAEGFMKGIR